MVMTPLPPPRTPEEAREHIKFYRWVIRTYRLLGIMVSIGAVIVIILAIIWSIKYSRI